MAIIFMYDFYDDFPYAFFPFTKLSLFTTNHRLLDLLKKITSLCRINALT